MKNFLLLIAVIIVVVCSLTPITNFLIKKGFQNKDKPWAPVTVVTCARIQMLLMNTTATRPALESSLTTFPNYPKRDKVHFWIALCYEKEKNNKAAKEWFDNTEEFINAVGNTAVSNTSTTQ